MKRGAEAPRYVTNFPADPPVGSHPVDEYEQSEPDHVDEVPVPGYRFEREMPFRREVARQMHTSMMAPSVTWKPWKPVSMKNVEP
jgi:hypothetical protein